MLIEYLQCATGGHLNMENFITGYPGHEFELRRAMKEEMGEEKYTWFFDKVSKPKFNTRDENSKLTQIFRNAVDRILLHPI